ncbi:sensor histidine kinase [Paenibacillaceae bacterium]|nr:sensor histidine kinase [Paenibacillaceae bacterium]
MLGRNGGMPMGNIHLNIRTKLILYFLISILLPTTIISIVFYTRSTEIITEKINMSVIKNLKSVESILLQKLDSINDYSVLITLNPELQNIISSAQPAEDEEIIDEILKLDSILDNYYLSDFSALTQTALYPKIYLMDRPKYKDVQISDKVYDISEVEKEPWYDSIPNQLSIVGINQLNVSGRQVQTLRISRKLVALRSADMAPEAALLTTDIDTGYFLRLMDSYKATAGSSISLLDTNGNVVLSSNKQLEDGELIRGGLLDGKSIDDIATGSAFHVEKIGGQQMLVSTNYIQPLNWNILSLTPLDEINIEQRNLNTAMQVVITVCMLFALLVALTLAGNISKPILALVKSMSSIDHGNLDIKLRYRKKDEFGILFNQYKNMMEKIKDLVERLYVSEMNKKEAELKAKDAELKALQAQINPHFLYNALDSINLYAMKHNVPNISSMVNSLSNFFRYGLSKGKSVITLQDEKRHVESYLEIQQMRLGDKLNYDIVFANEVMKCLTVKLALQPLVENAIIHGIQNVERTGHIRITADRVDDLLQITVADNGPGGNIVEMHEMLETDNMSSRSFGTRNVNERIKRVFGQKYGVRFRLNEAGGVTVIVEMPILRTMEGYHVDDDISG